ncbi:Kinesin-like protein [Pleurostoma richardsiae]|uniref:Kinesin-like protein n=1 Tax=Pleurostoma richardsiae TaxID=41990 RepID=A0AA38RDX0_9PEZI|nr:Kinesin-like protein [Pleurostoma richardsiae]
MDTTSSENAGFRASGLRPPRIGYNAAGAGIAGLHEITESQTNARAQASMLPPPQAGLKRAHPGTLSQPEAKRKTLQERAAEYPMQKSSVAATPAPRSMVKGVSMTTLASGIKPPSTTVPHSRHTSTNSLSSRQTSSSSYASSVGPGGRPVSSIGRPQTAMSFNHSTNGRQRANTTRSRPATAMSNHVQDEEPPASKQQNSWDVDERLYEVESQFKAMKEVMNVSLTDRKALEEVIELAKTRANELERERNMMSEKNSVLESEVGDLRQQLQDLTITLETERRSYKYDLEDKSREHRHELNELRRELKDETERLQRENRESLEALERHYRVEIEDERSRKSREIEEVQKQTAREVDELRARLGSEQQDLNVALQAKDREIQNMRAQLEDLRGDLDREKTLKDSLQKQLAEMSTTNMTLEDRSRALRAQIEFLESDSKAQSDSFASMEARLQEAIRSAEESRQKLIKEETERRVLFNKYQELKGNIRVMCRVRPVLDSSEGESAKIGFPDEKSSAQIDVTGPEEKSSLGNVTRKTLPFEFDRVFAPSVHNEEVFGEISQLVQSALDGYNVCIFCYGQTGSGKTYTMSSADGMIPRATHMIYETITKLKEKSWTYTMEGSFVEVYNEELHDLLTPAKEADGRKKLEIRHDDARKMTTVVNCKSVTLDSADKVELMLRQAQNNRSVAATKANERSSRSHSVFILKLVGENAATHERCEGTLNLVDLAGSERLKHSGAEGDRMRETQNINKSLACLGDVIEALGRGSAHVPYRNSKLTHLLQYSLGGNSKTLMFVMVSPLEAHLKETITSLRFATKVHNTHIGTAKSTKKSKERNSDS